MIATIIVVGALALAAAFSLAWLLRPALRRRIEEPSYRFAAQARQYDEAHHDAQHSKHLEQ
jgi:hypothetical protein